MTSVLHPNITQSFNMTSGGLRSDLNDVKSSGQYYVTHDLGREMDRIGNGVNHMKLDSDFINSSREWGQRFDVEALNREKAESAGKISEGSAFMGQYKSNFNVPKVRTLQENQVREMHEWAGQNLKGVKNELHPYAKSAQGRINQFCDYIGVTDRYTGYRHNLTRGSRDPTKLGMAWLNPATNNPYERSLHSGERSSGQVYLPASLPKRRMDKHNARLSVDNLNPNQSNVLRSRTAPVAKSIQERCGINTTFPGITEYMKRYNQRATFDDNTDFRINPTPDFSIYGRPTAKIEWSPNPTEYQTRYEWPQCSKIVKKPWLRK